MARYARASHRVASYEAGREKMFGEAFDRNERSENAQAFANSMRGGDAERASAAFTSLIGQGGTDEALTAAAEADWDNMDAGVSSRLLQTMGESDIDAFKAYAKYRQQHKNGGGVGFKDWASGNISAEQRQRDIDAGVKAENLSYANHLAYEGKNAMNNYDKDQMDFVRKNAEQIRTQMGKEAFGAMVGSAMVNANGAEAQTIAESIVHDELANNNIEVQSLDLSASDVASMRAEAVEAMISGVEGSNGSGGYLNVRNALETQIREIEADANLRNKMTVKTREALGIGSQVPTPPTPAGTSTYTGNPIGFS